jgi:hypothetical protein
MQWQDLGSRLISVGATGLGTIIGGPMGGAIGGVLGAQVGRALGVPATPEAIAAVIDERPEAAGPALQAFEAEHRDEIASLERASLSHQLEMAKLDRQDGFFSWGWRPGLMWLIGYLWLQNVVGTPVILNGIIGYSIPVMPYDVLLGLTVVISGFYMGGHTVKEAIKTWKGAGK